MTDKTPPPPVSLGIRSRGLFGASLLAGALLTVTGSVGAQTRIYVDANATGADTGDSWLDARPSLQNALGDVAAGADPTYEIWVAVGTYKPGDATSPLTVTFSVTDKLTALVGGFVSGDTDENQRLPANYELTILSGDLDNLPNAHSGDAYHVVTVEPGTIGTRIDGFKITRGNAVENALDGGGGVLVDGNPVSGVEDVRLENCTIEDNHARQGGGMYAQWGVGLMVVNCTFRDNTATAGGGLHTFELSNGTQNDGEDFNVWNTLFDGNQADVEGGGAYFESSESNVYNCIFQDNTATLGGAVYIYESEEIYHFSNSTFAFNEAVDSIFGSGQGGAFYIASSPGTTAQPRRIWNSILWNNTVVNNGLTTVNSIDGPEFPATGEGFKDILTVKFSDVEKPYVGSPPAPWWGQGNILADPKFRSPQTRDFTLQAVSLCVDAGNDSKILEDWPDLVGDGTPGGNPTPVDFASNTRVVGVKVDMGAYERP
jgi:Right handed beta helix region